MNIYNTVLYSCTEITNRLLKNKQELEKFLRFSAAMYKFVFQEQEVQPKSEAKPSPA